MKVNFVTVTNEYFASYRYHVQIPCDELKKLGVTAEISKYPLFDFDTYVFHKHINPGDYWYARALKSEGKRIVFHCCDHHFTTEVSDHYVRMIGLSDKVIVPTPEMAKAVDLNTGHKAIIITEPYEFPKKTPTFNPNGKLKVLWFGMPMNMDSLASVYPLPDFCDLRLCTKGDLAPKELQGIRYMGWSHKNMEIAFEWCDVVIMPMDLTDERNVGKSPNRVIESIRQGKFCIASPIPSYLCFDDWIYIGDIHEGLKWARQANPMEIVEKVLDAQEYIEDWHSPRLVGMLWKQALQ